ncbi:MAG: heavy metal-responsive transcriptional regulator [Acidobacteria bacterium]|nr:heavy metal-responsive transcriptional regulator [Acidobacteriota bacterium]MCI0622543.1 heavy metal-responsive transcriptional regulator [Acidobacteriota bacterium]MCI0724331.1 heavy metal-responsive transcriptional regulator [Acidobacteriota bacterium]
MQHAIQIGRLAKQTGLSIDAIRFYERKGLLEKPARSEGGFRLFSSRDIANLKFVRKAQELGFSLGEIHALIVLRDQDTQPCQHVQDMLEQKLTVIRQKIEELKTLEGELTAGLRKCRREISKARASHENSCPVLEQIGRADLTERKQK